MQCRPWFFCLTRFGCRGGVPSLGRVREARKSGSLVRRHSTRGLTRLSNLTRPRCEAAGNSQNLNYRAKFDLRNKRPLRVGMTEVVGAVQRSDGGGECMRRSAAVTPECCFSARDEPNQFQSTLPHSSLSPFRTKANRKPVPLSASPRPYPVFKPQFDVHPPSQDIDWAEWGSADRAPASAAD